MLSLPRTYTSDIHKLPHEEPGKKGETEGGYIYWLARKLREKMKTDADPRLDPFRLLILQAIPEYSPVSAQTEEGKAFRELLKSINKDITAERNKRKQVQCACDGISCAAFLSHP